MHKTKLPVDFDPVVYLELHPDVADAGVDPKQHFLEHGYYEGRAWKHEARQLDHPQENVHQLKKNLIRLFSRLNFWRPQTTSQQAFEASTHPSFKHTTYFLAYDELLSKYQGKPITFVEIGVLNGGSLFMWREFFGENARIIGIDLNPQAKKWENHGFEIYIGSQSDPCFWQKVISNVGCFDIVLDDGGHTYEQQIVTAECVLDNINDGGMLLIEDTHTSYMEGFGDQAQNLMCYVNVWLEKINMRFGEFRSDNCDNRVWSLEVFESIVALKVNRKAANVVSKPIWNRHPDKIEQDFRMHDFECTNQTKIEGEKIMANAFSKMK